MYRLCWIEILEKGLEALLDETYPAGANNAGLYKVNSYNILNGKSDTWVKKKKKILPQEVEKNNTEKEAYASTFRRLYPKGNHPKKEDKDLAKKDSGIWRKAKAFLEDRFEELLGDLYNA